MRLSPSSTQSSEIVPLNRTSVSSNSAPESRCVGSLCDGAPASCLGKQILASEAGVTSHCSPAPSAEHALSLVHALVHTCWAHTASSSSAQSATLLQVPSQF